MPPNPPGAPPAPPNKMPSLRFRIAARRLEAAAAGPRTPRPPTPESATEPSPLSPDVPAREEKAPFSARIGASATRTPDGRLSTLHLSFDGKSLCSSWHRETSSGSLPNYGAIARFVRESLDAGVQGLDLLAAAIRAADPVHDHPFPAEISAVHHLILGDQYDNDRTGVLSEIHASDIACYSGLRTPTCRCSGAQGVPCFTGGSQLWGARNPGCLDEHSYELRRRNRLLDTGLLGPKIHCLCGRLLFDSYEKWPKAPFPTDSAHWPFPEL